MAKKNPNLSSPIKRGMVFIISAPSGAGKTTIRSHLLRRNPQLKFSVSYTTRLPRPGEINGKDYHFVNREEFRRLIRKRGFLEWAEIHGELYGTGRPALEKLLSSGKDVLVEVDFQGQAQVKKTRPEAVSIFIVPESLAELKQRLRKRGTEKQSELRTRLKRARVELSKVKYYDYIVVNQEKKIALAVDQVKAIITAEHCRRKMVQGLISFRS
ncbi:MAG: guanylate kinase [Proteobacteria bacterium]|nr:guanylate kinase [Pseudomonadota bacterium]